MQVTTSAIYHLAGTAASRNPLLSDLLLNSGLLHLHRQRI